MKHTTKMLRQRIEVETKDFCMVRCSSTTLKFAGLPDHHVLTDYDFLMLQCTMSYPIQFPFRSMILKFINDFNDTGISVMYAITVDLSQYILISW